MSSSRSSSYSSYLPSSSLYSSSSSYVPPPKTPKLKKTGREEYNKKKKKNQKRNTAAESVHSSISVSDSIYEVREDYSSAYRNLAEKTGTSNIQRAEIPDYAGWQESSELNTWIEERQNVQRVLGASNLQGIDLVTVDGKEVVNRMKEDAKSKEERNFQIFLQKTFFQDDAEDLKDFRKKGLVYEWNLYKNLFPEYLAEPTNRAFMVLKLNTIFAKMSIYGHIKSKQDLILLYLYNTDKQIRNLVSDDVIAELLKLTQPTYETNDQTMYKGDYVYDKWVRLYGDRIANHRIVDYDDLRNYVRNEEGELHEKLLPKFEGIENYWDRHYAKTRYRGPITPISNVSEKHGKDYNNTYWTPGLLKPERFYSVDKSLNVGDNILSGLFLNKNILNEFEEGNNDDDHVSRYLQKTELQRYFGV